MKKILIVLLLFTLTACESEENSKKQIVDNTQTTEENENYMMEISFSASSDSLGQTQSNVLVLFDVENDIQSIVELGLVSFVYSEEGVKYDLLPKGDVYVKSKQISENHLISFAEMLYHYLTNMMIH